MRAVDPSVLRIPCSSLRVYRLAHPSASDEREAIIEDDVFGIGLTDPASRRHRYRLEHAGEVWCCEAQPKLRMYLALAAAMAQFGRAELPTGAEPGTRALELLRSQPDRPPVLDAAWHVPLTWFIAFDPSERILEENSAGLSVRYLASLSDATDRVSDAVSKLSNRIPDSVVQTVSNLKSWLESFGSSGIVELDYGALTSLFDPSELADEDTVSEIWAAIGNMADGYPVRSALLYRRAEQRWSAKAGIPERN